MELQEDLWPLFNFRVGLQALTMVLKHICLKSQTHINGLHQFQHLYLYYSCRFRYHSAWENMLYMNNPVYKCEQKYPLDLHHISMDDCILLMYIKSYAQMLLQHFSQMLHRYWGKKSPLLLIFVKFEMFKLYNQFLSQILQ